jgi:rod shape determining protein RodA
MLFEKAHVLKSMNKLMLLGIALLMTIGVFFIYSACYVSEDQPVRMLYLKQMLWAAVGLLIYVWIAMNDYRALGKHFGMFYLCSLILLVAVLVFGSEISGAKRWLVIFGINVQPSEFAKMATLMLLAYVMSRPSFDSDSFLWLMVLVGIIALPCALIFSQPDLGTSVTLAIVGCGLIFAGGIRLRNLVLLCSIVLIVVSVGLAVLLVPSKLGISEGAHATVLKCTGIHDYQLRRIRVFMSTENDPLQDDWNEKQSKIAVGSGGLTGKGFLKGTQNILGFLPKSVAPTDFIYSVIAEERGFLGSIVVIGLFVLVIACGTLIALETRDEFGRLICVGVMVLMFFHAFVNMAMTVGLLPITGLPLPLLSYGGSFTVVTLAGLGFVQSVHIRSRRPVEY